MTPEFDLTGYLNRGAKQLIHDVAKATLTNPHEAAFLRRYARGQRAMEARRMAHEASGTHIPMFLIASITNACNLYCKGCYARANGQCGTQSAQPLLTAAQWGGLFRQGQEAGIPFILLAGGEPLMRADVLAEASRCPDVLFPVFTNGTMLDPAMLALLHRHRNLVPVVSLEGGQAATDARRGQGTHQCIQAALDHLCQKKLLFGVSLTVTTENRAEVTSHAFIQSLKQKGCRLVFLIEYVPVAPGTEHLAPDDAQRLLIEQAQASLRMQFPGMVFLSFPGDEKHMGGCLAAGRGFFHINAYGGAEPCPFSPYSDVSLRQQTLLQALDSPFFTRVRALNAQGGAHTGGCALFEKEAQVKTLLCAPQA